MGVKRSCDEENGLGKHPRKAAPTSASLVELEGSPDSGAVYVGEEYCGCVVIRRKIEDGLQQRFKDYVDSMPHWPQADHLHPQEASIDRVAIIDLSHVAKSAEDPLSAAKAFGCNLPHRGSPNEADGRMGIASVASVLPDASMRDLVCQDAEDLITSLCREFSPSCFQVRLEFVRGDTCQKWHRDVNIARCLVTYVGPGTLLADNSGVTRGCDGAVIAVEEGSAVQASQGDVVLMKGGAWPGGAHGGTAHRAPPIGSVGNCSQCRLLLKVDIFEL